jgi:multiple sugar transport system substrate-binding protein
MRFFHFVCLAAVVTAACSGESGPPLPAIVFKHGKVPGEHRLLRDLLDRFEKEQGIRVVDETLPASSDVQHQYFITTLEGGASDLDVLSMDVIWVPEFSRAGWLLDLSEAIPLADRQDFFPSALEACTYRGRLFGVPWYIDGGVLYYRKDLLDKHRLEVPRTYPELADTALAVLAGEARPDLYGFLWQGKQYEGLVCVAMEVLSSFGGQVLEDGRVTIDSAEARAALRFLRELLTRGASPPLVTTADEETTRTLFGSGRAVFLRNWVYAWNLFQAEGSSVRGKVGLTRIPPGPLDAGGATLGGWQLGVSRYSANPEKALALVSFLTRPDSQAYLTRTVGYRPSRRSLYRDAGLLAELPVLSSLLPILESARPRPVTPLYPALSQTLQSEFSAIVAGVKDVDAALADARRELEFILTEIEEDASVSQAPSPSGRAHLPERE